MASPVFHIKEVLQMKKFALLLCVCFVLTAVSSAFAYRGAMTDKYPVDGVVINVAANDRLNIRAKPNARSRILGRLRNGEYVVVNGEALNPSDGSLWYYIYDEYSDVSGFVSSKFIELQ